MTETSPLARYLVPLKRWWWVIAAVVVLGLAAAALTLPGSPGDASADEIADPDVTFRATHILYRDEMSREPLNFDLVMLLARQGEVTNRVVDRLGGQVTAGEVEGVTVEADPEIGTISVTATQESPDLAVELVDVFAEELTAVVDERALTALEEQAVRVQGRLEDLESTIGDLEDDLDGLAEEDIERRLLEAELDAALGQYAAAQSEATNLAERIGGLETQFETLQEPSPVRTDLLDSGPLGLPRSLLPRLAIAGLLSLLLGALLALLIDRFDPRLRTRRDAEEAFGLPVIAQFPLRNRSDRDRHPLPVVTEPAGITAESFRALRLAITTAPTWQLSGRAPTTDGSVGTVAPVTDHEPPETLVVTSSLMGDGKSTLVANLAASFAESGVTVLVVDCDFRRPAVGELLGVPGGRGLTDLLDPLADDIRQLVQPTRLARVTHIRAGRAGVSPPWFVTESATLVDHTRPLADVVIFDTGPILLTNEATALIPATDSVIVVSRGGRVRRPDARATVEQLAQASANVAGLVLIGGDMPRRYGYGYYGTGRSQRPDRRAQQAGRRGRHQEREDVPDTSASR